MTHPSKRKYLHVGDHVVAKTTIIRRDGGSVMLPGDTGVVTQVFNSDRSQIVGVRPDDSRQLPLIDIVCMLNSPPVFEVVR